MALSETPYFLPTATKLELIISLAKVIASGLSTFLCDILEHFTQSPDVLSFVILQPHRLQYNSMLLGRIGYSISLT